MKLDRLLLAELYSGEPAAARTRLAVLNPDRSLPARLIGCTDTDEPAAGAALATYAGLRRLVGSCNAHDEAALTQQAAAATGSGTGVIGYSPAVLDAGAAPAAVLEEATGPQNPRSAAYPVTTVLTGTPSDPDAAAAPVAAWLRWAAGPGQQQLPAGLLPLTTSQRSVLQAAVVKLTARSAAAAALPVAPPRVAIPAATASGAAAPTPMRSADAKPSSTGNAPRLPKTAPSVKPAPPVPAQPVADLAALNRPPTGLLTGSGFGTAAAVRLVEQPVMPLTQPKVPAPLLAPELPAVTQATLTARRAAVPSTPSYDLLPGLLAGLLVGTGFLCCIRYLNPQRLTR